MRNHILLSAVFFALSAPAYANSIILPTTDNSLSLTIYNQNTALVKDIRPASLKSGVNEVIFDGVARQIQAETAIIYGDDIKVSEQNYSYNLMSYDNFINRNIGNQVRTVLTNPKNGENIYDQAELIGYANGQPILRFSYGIESNFPGRVVFDNVPAGMSNKPTLAAKLDVKNSGNKNLYLAYLTSGLSWKTDYVANIKDDHSLDLTGWVTISNNSGIDYERAKIQLIAGDVNIVRAPEARPLMAKMVAANSVMDESVAFGVSEEALNSYELYTLPSITTVKDKENKQIALIEKNGVKYKKDLTLSSPFYFSDSRISEFKKRHPAIVYVINNTAKSNLGIALPAGIVRFYENDRSGNMQFIGSNRISNTAKEDEIRLNLGEAFNISLSGQVTKTKEKEIERKPQGKCAVIKTKKSYDVEITVNNAEDNKNTIVIEQDFPTEDYAISKESVKSKQINSYTRRWEVEVSKNDKAELKYSVDITYSNAECH